MYFAKRLLFLQALLHFFLLGFCTSLQNITINRSSLKDGDVLLSTGKIFALGFFSLGKSNHRYVGIWYKQVQDRTYVWVANRDNPINDNSGVLSIDVNGVLVLHAKNGKAPIWSTNITVSNSKPTNSTLAELSDEGCLTLFRDETRSVEIWKSFDHPTDTMLPNMKLGLDRRTGLNPALTSWKSKDDPGTGNFSYQMNTNGSPQLFLYKNNVPWWRSGHWNGLGWSGIPTLQTNNFIFLITFENNESEVTTKWTVVDPTIPSTLVVNESTESVTRSIWSKERLHWTFLGERPGEPCEHYLKCGAFGTCEGNNGTSVFKCTCLPGFEPRSRRDWDLRNTSGGCVKKRQAVSICGNGEGFIQVRNLKLPDTSVALVDNSSILSCHQSCLQNCSCTAYANLSVIDGKIGCLKWHGDLLDTRSFPEGGQDLFVRVDKFELAGKSQGFFANKKRLAILMVLIAVTSVLILFSAYWLRKRQRKGSQRLWTSYNDVISSPTRFEDSAKLDESRSRPDLPFFELSSIIVATDNFASDNKLGQGGFGPVYKGQLVNGQEIAVKRLSRSSGQGIEEFKNEVMLIAKLQHRNLVRLFGCCIHKEDKMLIYEYMPNKSLDFFIFDEIRRPLLDWRKRFDIIFGIARGVLYLHQDSRLKIIHRDLKASNVLLDTGMNPKISDFGMARMFGDDQIEASTNRVVGTYGYMSPEYAMEGLYSIKSDVFSYGVLTLEIVSGKRNNHFPVGSASLNLIEHAWDLWMEGKALDVVDSSFGEEYPTNQVLRCIHIGLLCVQERAIDRPTMPEIVFMLGNETTLPSPKKPAFINRTLSPAPDSSISGGDASLNDETMSTIQAR